MFPVQIPPSYLAACSWSPVHQLAQSTWGGVFHRDMLPRNLYYQLDTAIRSLHHERRWLKLVKVDIMGPHCDVLILLSGAVLFSKANVKGKGKGKSREVSWACDEASSQADRGSPHAHTHSCCHSKHFKLAAIVGDGDDTIDDDASSMLGATSATSMTAPSMTGLGYNPS